MALTALTDYYNSNANELDVDEALKPIMLADESTEAKQWLLDYYIAHSDDTAARGLLASMATWSDKSEYIALKTMQLDLMNDWSAASTSQMSDVETWASNPLSSAYGDAIGILHSLGLSDVLPEPEVPLEERSLELEHSPVAKYQKPQLSAYPNPAKETTYISYPIEVDGIGQMEIHDGLGKLVLRTTLNSKGIFELNTSKLTAGVYLIRVIIDQKLIADSKLVVID